MLKKVSTFTLIVKLFLALFLTGIPGISHALTLSQIRTEIRNNIRDNPTDTARRTYPDSELLLYINEGQKDAVNQSWLAEKVTSYSLTPFTSYYALPTDYLNVDQVYFKNNQVQIISLQEYTQRKLYNEFPSWETSGGNTPVYYWVSNSTSPNQNNSPTLRISYIPIPNKSSTGTVTLWYYSIVSDLSSDSDVPFDNRAELYSYHYALVYYAIMRIKIIEKKPEQATVFQNLYNSYISTMKSRLGSMPNYTPSAGGR